MIGQGIVRFPKNRDIHWFYASSGSMDSKFMAGDILRTLFVCFLPIGYKRQYVLKFGQNSENLVRFWDVWIEIFSLKFVH